MLNARVPTRKWTTHVTSLQRDNGRAHIQSTESVKPDTESDSDDKHDSSTKYKSEEIYSGTQDADAMERQ